MGLLPLVLILSLMLNLWGNGWGTPKAWHADEITIVAASMVSERNPSPRFYMYGVLPYYAVALGAVVPAALYAKIVDRPPPIENARAWEPWSSRQYTRITRLARGLSAVVSTLTVALTFLIGLLLFDRWTGLLAALLVAVSRTFVMVAHYATVDSYATFFFWLACLAALLAWRYGDRRWYWLAGLAAGIAIGIKVDRMLVFFPILVAHFLRPAPDRRWHDLAAAAALVPVGFLIANPPLLFNSFEFLDGFSRELAFNALRPRFNAEIGFLQIPRLLNLALGTPLFLLSVAGLLFSLTRIAAGRDRRALLWLLSTLLPYYLLFSSRLIEWSYMTLLVPGLTLLAAYAGIAAFRLTGRRLRPLVAGAIAAVAAVTIAYTVALLTHFEDGTRDRATAWIERNVPPGSTIGIHHARGPLIPGDRGYVLVSVLRDRDLEGDVAYYQGGGTERLASHPMYLRLRSGILAAERWAGRTLGTPVRDEPYLAWFDLNEAQYQRSPVAGAARVDPLEQLPDFLVLMDSYHPHSLPALQAPTSGYQVVARFTPRRSFGGLAWEYEFIDPEVTVFRRVGPVVDAPPLVFQR